MQPSETSLFRRKWVFLWLAASVVLLAVMAFGGYRFYKRWQPERLAKQARAYFDKGDIRNGSISIRNALAINPNSVAACRIMAEVNEKMAQPDAILWRRRVVDLAPGSFKDSIAWAASALRFGQTAIAEKALESVLEKDRHNQEYHATAGAVAVTGGKVKQAEFHFGEAVKLDPQNELYQYNRATLQINSANPGEVAAARSVLEKLTDSAKLGTFAQRALVMNLAASKQLDEARKYSDRLRSAPAASFSDRILHLNVLHRSTSDDFAAYLAELKQQASDKPDDAGALILWLSANGMAAEAMSWAQTLSAEVLATAPVGSALAPCYLATSDWGALQQLVAESNWEAKEYLRQAFFARALREQGDKTGTRAHWTSALTAASKRPESLRHLAQVVGGWKWDEEMVDLLWAAASENKDPGWALGSLYRHYLAAGDTRGLHRVANRMMEVDPNNETAKNNFAMFSLLLNSNTDRALKMARELYDKHYDKPAIVSTYALALHVQGRSDEALQIMNTLSLDQLAQPAMAAYYGMLLNVTGATELAKTYLDLGAKATLLPEEKTLVFASGNGP